MSVMMQLRTIVMKTHSAQTMLVVSHVLAIADLPEMERHVQQVSGTFFWLFEIRSMLTIGFLPFYEKLIKKN